MANASQGDTKMTPTNILNRTFDPDFNVVSTELLGYNQASNSLKRVAVDANGNFGISANISGADGSIIGDDGVTKATVLDYTSSNPLAVRLTDTNGDYVSAGAGTQYTEDAASAADPIGSALIARRRDTLSATEVSSDGDNIALNATNKGQLHVKVADTVTVDASGTAVPVTDNGGSLTVDGTVSVTGVATSAKQDTGNTSLASIDGKITAVNTGAVVVSSSALPTGAATAAKQPALGTAGTASADVLTVQGIASMTALKVDGSAFTQPVSGTVTANIGTVATLATAAKQDTGNTSLASIDTKTPSLGQALAASSVPVVLPAAQITTLTPPAAITGYATATKQSDGSQKSQIVDGAGNVIGSTSNALDVNIKSGSSSGTQYTEGDTDTTITGNAMLFETNTGTSALGVVSSANPLPISDNGGAITVDGSLTSVATITNVVHVDDNSGTLSIDDGAGSITVDGTVAATQSGNWNITNVSGTVSLPTGAATGAKQDTGNSSLSSIDGKITACNTGAVVVSSGSITADTELTTADLDLGAGTDTRAVVGIVGSKSGGAQLIPGDATAGLKVDLGVDNDVTITSGTITTITNVVHVDDNASTISIDDGAGSLTVDGSVTVTQATGTNLHAVIDSGTVSTITNVVHVDDNSSTLSIDDGAGSITVDGTVAATQSGTWNVGTVTAVTGITNNVNTVEVAPTTVLNGKKTVTTAGTRVALAASTACKSVTIKALSTNTGLIYVGDSSVASTNGFQLSAGETVSFDIANLSTVNLDSSVNGEGVSYIAIN